jgi:hypothetical protein
MALLVAVFAEERRRYHPDLDRFAITDSCASAMKDYLLERMLTLDCGARV